MILWHRLDPARVERAVQALVRILYQGAEAMDGAGGDGGRDVIWRSREGLVIFEIKSYAERLKAAQITKIKKSLTNAVKHRPVRWVLIVPLNHSPAEDAWFDELRRKYPAIELEWWGIDWLDGQFAERPYLRRYVEDDGYTLLQLAQEFDREQAVLAGGLSDAALRSGRLHQQVDSLSPFWRVDITLRPDGPLFTFSERYPGAGRDDPLSVKPVFTFPADDPDAEETERQLKRGLGYGRKVTIPQRFIERCDIDASEETRRAFGWDDPSETTEFQFLPTENNEGLPLPCTLDVTTPEGVPLASLQVQLTRRTGGHQGITVSGTDQSGVLTLTMMLDRAGNDDNSGLFEFDVAEVIGRWPFAMRPAADFLLAAVPGNRIELSLGHVCFGYHSIEEPLVEGISSAARMAVALDKLQKYFGQQFPVPDGLTGKDLRELEMLCELVANGKTQWVYHGMKVNIRADRLDAFLSNKDFQTGKGALLVRQPHFVIWSCCGLWRWWCGPLGSRGRGWVALQRGCGGRLRRRCPWVVE
jgi:hypothetical protein